MFELQAGPSWYQRSGLLLWLAQFSLFVFGLPPFQVGIWYQSEPTLDAIFVFAILNSVWLGTGLVRGWLICTAMRPLMLCLLLWILWQLVATELADSFWRSWFGPAEIGEGVGRSIALLLLVMLGFPLWQIASYPPLILAAAAGNIILQCLLHWFNPLDPAIGFTVGTWVPSRFAAYLAFMAGNLWIAAISSRIIKRQLHYGLLMLFTLAVLWVSLNKSAMLLLPMAMVIGVAALFLSDSPAAERFLAVTKKWRMIAIVGCFLPMGWIAFSVVYGGSVGNAHKNSFVESILTKDEGIGARVPLNQVAVSTMQHEPHRWLAGDGWGRFTDDVFKYALVDGVYVFHDGIRDPNWSQLEGSAFHSHSEPLEVLLSLGIPGLLLWFAFPVIILLTLPRHLFWPCAPMLVALVALTYFWFEMPQCLAYDALLLVVLNHACRFTPRPAMVLHHRPCIGIIAACGVAMLWSAQQQTEAMLYGETLNSATLQGKPYNDYTTDWLLSDLKRGGDRLHTASIAYGLQLTSRKAVEANDRGWYALLLEAAHLTALSPLSGARVASTEVWLEYKLLLDLGGFRSFADLGHQAALSMPGAILELCRKAPLRDDYATMFLMNLADITHNDKMQQDGILMSILTIAPRHRPALWLLGKLLATQKGHEVDSKAFLQYAASLEVWKVYPITSKELQDALQDK